MLLINPHNRFRLLAWILAILLGAAAATAIALFLTPFIGGIALAFAIGSMLAGFGSSFSEKSGLVLGCFGILIFLSLFIASFTGGIVIVAGIAVGMTLALGLGAAFSAVLHRFKTPSPPTGDAPFVSLNNHTRGGAQEDPLPAPFAGEENQCDRTSSNSFWERSADAKRAGLPRGFAPRKDD